MQQKGRITVMESYPMPLSSNPDSLPAIRKTIRIYGLGNPSANDLLYIDMTQDDLTLCLDEILRSVPKEPKSRLHQWLQELLAHGERPDVFEIDSAATVESATELLEFWRNYMKMLGVQMLDGTPK